MPPRHEGVSSKHGAVMHESEETPLIDHSLSIDDDEEICRQSSTKRGYNDTCSDSHREESLIYNELKGMTVLAVPVVSTYLLEFLPGLVSIVLVGHVHHDKTEEYLDAAALAVVFMNLTGLSIGIGLATAMDTLCSQAYGAQRSERMGIYLQTGFQILAVFCLFIGVIFYYAADILVALGQPMEVSELTGAAVLTLLPGVPFLFLYELLRKVLQAQNIASPMFYVSVAANIVNAGVGYYLVYYTEVGWLGASIARSICNMSFFLLLLPYILASGRLDTFWTGWHPMEAFEGIPAFLALGIPGMFQLCFEWWAFEILALLCGLLPNAVVSIGANAVIMNVSAMVYMLYLGLSISGNVRIGNALGAGDDKRARVAALATIGLSGAMALLSAMFLLVFRNVLPSIFTHDETIDELSSMLICVAAVFQIPDAINGAIQGVFRGSGRQNLGAKLNFVAYYMLGIPFGFVMAFAFNLGVVGLWLGMTVGLSFIAICGTVLVVRSDWAKLSEDAKSRVHSRRSWSNLLDAN